MVRTWKKRGNMEKLLSCLKKSTLDCLLRDFCLAHQFILFYLKVLFSLPQRCLFNKVDAFFFWSYNYISIADWRFNPNHIFLFRQRYIRRLFLGFRYSSLIYGSDFQQLFYIYLHLLTSRAIVSNKLRPKLIVKVSLDNCIDNPVLTYLRVCTGLESKGRENNIVILYI